VQEPTPSFTCADFLQDSAVNKVCRVEQRENLHKSVDMEIDKFEFDLQEKGNKNRSQELPC